MGLRSFGSCLTFFLAAFLFFNCFFGGYSYAGEDEFRVPFGAIRVDTLRIEYLRDCYGDVRNLLNQGTSFHSWQVFQKWAYNIPVVHQKPGPDDYYLTLVKTQAPAPYGRETFVTLHSTGSAVFDAKGYTLRYRCGNIGEWSAQRNY